MRINQTGRQPRSVGFLVLGLLTLATINESASAQMKEEAKIDASELYQTNCASCHGVNRQGSGVAPGLDDSTYRYGGRPADLRRIIRDGIPSRGMPGFAAGLSAEEIDALAAWLPSRTPDADGGSIDNPLNAAPQRQIDPTPGTTQTLDYVIRADIFAEGMETIWGLAFIDGETALATEKQGRLRIIRKGILDPRPIEGIPSAYTASQGGLLDVAVDPQHTENGWIYLSYSHALPETAEQERPSLMTRIVRGRIRDHRWVDEEPVYTAENKDYTRATWHYGGRMAFGPNGDLYLSVGDRGSKELAQDKQAAQGKIHRISLKGNKRKSTIHSYGHRHPQGLTFDPSTGALWSAEHGPRGGDEINYVVKDGNYGWPINSYGINYDSTLLTPHTQSENTKQPAYFWRPSIGVSGLAFYDGEEFPLWRGKLLVTGLAPRDLRLLTIVDNHVLHEEIIFRLEGRSYGPVVGPDGAIYVVMNDPGKILRLTAERERRM